jgi:hypothetical protein
VPVPTLLTHPISTVIESVTASALALIAVLFGFVLCLQRWLTWPLSFHGSLFGVELQLRLRFGFVYRMVLTRKVGMVGLAWLDVPELQ